MFVSFITKLYADWKEFQNGIQNYYFVRKREPASNAERRI
jgi:hypothetical protein